MFINFKRIVFVLFLLMFFSLFLNARQITGKDYLKSLVLPGLGEVTSQHSSGYVFFASELLVWSSRFYVINGQKLKDKQSVLYAQKYAHINKNVKFDDDYIGKVKRYMSSGFETGGYNQQVLQQAIELYPNDKEMQDTYIRQNMIPDDMAWQWDSKDNKHDYGIMRKRILQYSNYLKVNAGLLLVNRLLSVINLTRIKKAVSLDVSMNNNFDTVISLRYKF